MQKTAVKVWAESDKTAIQEKAGRGQSKADIREHLSCRRPIRIIESIGLHTGPPFILFENAGLSLPKLYLNLYLQLNVDYLGD